jgi:hypothetical protein
MRYQRQVEQVLAISGVINTSDTEAIWAYQYAKSFPLW